LFFDTRTGRLSALLPRPTQQNICHFVAFIKAFYIDSLQAALMNAYGPCHGPQNNCFVSLGFRGLFLLPEMLLIQSITKPPCCQLTRRPFLARLLLFLASSCLSAIA
jgi:hypothetical protein